jgi:dTDP-4-dehydrorhamnose 3,5-epimerase
LEFEPLGIADLILVRPQVLGDARGFFMESWARRQFAAAGIDVDFVQDNHSHSSQHILRGLHYQIAPHAQGKLVRVTSGAVFDVAVDLRRGSPTFGRWAGAELSEHNRHMLWVPPGFAHGFLVLSARADFLYKCTDYYAPQSERSIVWNDPDLSIRWPLPAGIAPLLSARDASAGSFAQAEYFP